MNTTRRDKALADALRRTPDATSWRYLALRLAQAAADLHTLTHDAQVGNGPLIHARGHVAKRLVAIVARANGSTSGTATLRDFLDTFGIPRKGETPEADT